MIYLILQFILCITFVAGVHELGHMLMARLCNMRVLAFFIGFPPKVIKKKIGETEYGIGAIPVGGFVQIAGMIDENNLEPKDDNNSDKATEIKSWEFRAKPAWQRMLVMSGGILFNILSAIIILALFTYNSTKEYVKTEHVNQYGIVVNEIGTQLGLKTGDKIVSCDGVSYDDFDEYVNLNTLINSKTLTVKRDNELIDIEINEDFKSQILNANNQKKLLQYMTYIRPRVPFCISNVINPSLINYLKSGDKIVSVNDIPINFLDEFKSILENHKNEEVIIQYKRNDTIYEIQEKIRVNEKGELGINVKSLLPLSIIRYGFIESLISGFKQSFNIVKTQCIGLYQIVTGKLSASKSLSGPIGIAKIFGKEINWSKFWNITALLSLCLAVMNLLPIPALDGGHIFLLLIEIIIGRKISEKYILVLQKIGMFILVGLTIYALYNDIHKILIN